MQIPTGFSGQAARATSGVSPVVRRDRPPNAGWLVATILILTIGAGAYVLRDVEISPRLLTRIVLGPPAMSPAQALQSPQAAPVSIEAESTYAIAIAAAPESTSGAAATAAPVSAAPVTAAPETPVPVQPEADTPKLNEVAQVASPRVVRGPRAANAAESFRDCTTCPELISLGGGSFEMGSNDSPTQRPVHRVTVEAFALGRFPVTVGEWRYCVQALACSYQPTGDDDQPVHNVSWTDALQYLGWLSRITQRPYRLPTEAEWEYAARAETTTKYWWGNQLVRGMANCRGCAEPYDAQGPTKIGEFASNGFGLYDMAGGVWQWVSDCWHANYRGAPNDGSSWDVPRCVERVLRGGSWLNDPSFLRTASRNRYDPDVRYPANGLRVARSP